MTFARAVPNSGKIEVNGYEYFKNQILNNGITLYDCVRRRKHGCMAKVKVDSHMSVVQSINSHNHDLGPHVETSKVSRQPPYEKNAAPDNYRLVDVESEQQQLCQPQQFWHHLTPTQAREESKKAPTAMDLAIRKILDNDMLTDGLKGKLYSETLARYKNADNVEKKFPDTEVLDSVPVNVRHKAKRILREIAENPNTEIDPRGRFVYKQTPIENSNIIELVDDILRTKRIAPPPGWREFAESLGKLDKSIISNPHSWSVIEPPRPKRKRKIKWDDDL